MNAITKNLIPNKEWIVTVEQSKIGSISKKKKGYSFLKKGSKIDFKSLEEIKESLGIVVLDGGYKNNIVEEQIYKIYDYPCSSKPFEPIFNLKERLPLFSKSAKSKSKYCAGYYVIKFRKNWVKSFCPKLITLERYEYFGPFKTDEEMRQKLTQVNKL